MFEYIKSEYQFLWLLLIWLIAGIYGGPIIYALIVASLLLLKYKNRYTELFLGFLFILILSDSRVPALSFAANFKPIYILLLAIFLLFDTKKFNSFNHLFYAFVPFFIISFILLFRSEIVAISFQKTLSYALLFLVVPNYVSKCYRESNTLFLKRLVYLIVLILLAGFLFILINPAIAFDVRFRGILGNPNGLGIFCALFFLLFSIIIQQKPTLFSKVEIVIIYGLLILSILLSGSRNSLIVIIIFLFFRRFYKLSPLLGTIIFLVFVIAYQVVLNNIVPVILSLGLEEYFRIETLDTFSNRAFAWQYAWEKIQENFFFGKGFAHDEYIFRNFYEETETIGRVANVHNSVLGFWLNTGLTGVLLYLAAFLWRFIQAAKLSNIAIPVMFAIIFSSNFEAWLIASLNPFTIQLVIILTLLTNQDFIKQVQAKNIEAKKENIIPAL